MNLRQISIVLNVPYQTIYNYKRKLDLKRKGQELQLLPTRRNIIWIAYIAAKTLHEQSDA